MLKDTLEELGLGEKDIDVYLALIQVSSAKPVDLALRLDLPRTTVQNVLIRLERKGLAMQVTDSKTLSYMATHPKDLLLLFEKQKCEAIERFRKIEGELTTFMPELLSIMHANKTIPQVRFFKGIEGAKEVLFDTLTSKTELKDYANIDAMFDIIKDVNDEYVEKREKTKITKRSLLLETDFAKEVYKSGSYSPKSHKGYKWISQELYPFSIEMNIYSGKVSYLTYVEGEIIGVIIENDYIYQMHNSTWDLVWDMLPEPGKS